MLGGRREAVAPHTRSQLARLAALLVLLGTFAATSCGTAGDAYYDAQEDWTRSEESYTGFESRAFIHATLKTTPFRRAYAAEYARLYALTPEQSSALLQAELDEVDRQHVVVAAFYTPQLAWNDLNPKRGFWEVRLEGSGGYAHPFEVRRLDTRNPLYQKLFPYITPQFTLYELRFDRTSPDGTALAAPGEPLSLVVAGAPTRLRLTWKTPAP